MANDLKDHERHDTGIKKDRSKEAGDISRLRLDQETGVWTFGLTQVTIFLVIIIQISFITMLYVSCSQGFTKCTERIPMISDVIKDHMFDRVFLLLNTGYFLGIHQVNVRSLYSRFHGIITKRLNDALIVAGMISCFSLPMIGVFDNRDYVPIHNACAATFFASSAFYLSTMAYQMSKHKDKLLD
jgi:Frag1/DRAM/Sfk1 family